jgi:hypothetical protein
MAPCILLATTNVVIAFYLPAILKYFNILKTSSVESNTKSETTTHKSGTEKSGTRKAESGSHTEATA